MYFGWGALSSVVIHDSLQFTFTPEKDEKLVTEGASVFCAYIQVIIFSHAS
jgi:hypothetical protein